ncbi:hypothetical protein F2P81_000687 [Scophthalmus maximus]|uniref:Uncharacterized protein n=1 Tax=Scophthalmus maximus TaxID=52904 RepID=A0A6A4TV60_SCOMX|nr:hypothetical protein F2P81_000687 [Scophthalmus maximus]
MPIKQSTDMNHKKTEIWLFVSRYFTSLSAVLNPVSSSFRRESADVVSCAVQMQSEHQGEPSCEQFQLTHSCYNTYVINICMLPQRLKQWTWTQKEGMQRGSVGGAEWKTSDFVVMLIKEQQVPVCLSAQAVLFSPRQL